MSELLVYPAVLGTILSIILLSRLTFQEKKIPARTLSEYATSDPARLRSFRNILLVCNTLFSVSTFSVLIPKSSNTALVLGACICMAIGIYGCALIPAKGSTKKLHLLFAVAMGVSMPILALVCAIELTGAYRISLMACFGIMTLFALLMLFDEKRYIVHELLFIFTSHISILIALLAFL